MIVADQGNNTTFEAQAEVTQEQRMEWHSKETRTKMEYPEPFIFDRISPHAAQSTVTLVALYDTENTKQQFPG